MKREQKQVLLAQQGSSITRESSSRLVLSPTNRSICHIERSEISQKQGKDISVSAKPQYDNLNTLDKVCHTERSEVSQKQSRDISPTAQYDKVDISVSAKPQYDNLNTLDKVCHTERSEVSQANFLNCHTERSEVSQKQKKDISPTAQYDKVDISVSTKPQYDNLNTLDKVCHTERSEVSQANFLNCHTERSEVSQVESNRDISVSTKPQYDNRDSSLNATHFAQNDNAKSTRAHNAKSARNDEKQSKSKRLALSLIAAGALTGLALDSLAAACSSAGREGTGYAYTWIGGKAWGNWQIYNCTGDMATTQLDSNSDRRYYQTDFYRTTTINFGTGNQELNVNGPRVTVTLETRQIDQNKWWNASTKNINFGLINASGTTFQITVSGNTTTNISTIGTGEIGGLDLNANGGTISSVAIGHGTSVGTINVVGNIGRLSITGSGSRAGETQNSRISSVGSLTGSGTIGTLTLNGNLGNNIIAPTIGTANVYRASVTIDSPATTWNNVTSITNEKDKTQHLYFNNLQSSVYVHPTTQIFMEVGGTNTPNDGNDYKLDNLIVAGNTAGGAGGARGQQLTRSMIRDGSSAQVIWKDDRTFYLRADARNSYTANAYRALALSYMRRNAMTENILNTMTTKTFHSDRYYNQEVELRLLQYDLSRLTNRSSKFSKQTRKNQSKVDKVREKMAKLTLEQSKGQNLDKGYNNFELIDQLDAIFIPYTGRRDWRFFALPYASHTYAYLGNAETTEWAGGALFGVQRNLRNAGIFGGYVGYEFANTDTALITNDARVQTHSLQAGLNYFKTFAITSKVWEGFIKASVRGGVDMPTLHFAGIGLDSRIYLKSESANTAVPLMYSLGASVSGGLTFYQFKRNSYVSPEIGLSYDMLSALATQIIKPRGANGYLPMGPDEHTKVSYWHLPQLSVSARYYKMWGNTFRTNAKVGIKYNMLSRQTLPLSLGEGGQISVDKDNKEILLPSVYGNVAFDLVWLVKKNHELSLGYDGLFFASTFGKDTSGARSGWFNGVTTTLNFKYAYWFGGTDYVTDESGNAVSRSIAENKKSKKGKKSKKKKKKSKKKVYYIDG